MDLSFEIHKLGKFLENSDKVHFEGLVHLLRYIGDNKNLRLKYYADMNNAPVTDLLRQACNVLPFNFRVEDGEIRSKPYLGEYYWLVPYLS